MIIKVVGALLAVPLAGAVFSGVSPANPASPVSVVSSRACTHTVQTQVNGTQSPGWSQVRWVENSCGFSVRGVSKCEDPGKPAHKVIRTGGYVHLVDLWSRATCPGTQPFIAEAGYDVLLAGGGFTRTWYWRG